MVKLQVGIISIQVFDRKRDEVEFKVDFALHWNDYHLKYESDWCYSVDYCEGFVLDEISNI